MKKTMLFMTVAALATGLYAGSVNDPILEFSSTGPDTYADGSAALVGECYALAYVAKDATFSLKSDGTAGDGVEYILFAPVAKHDANGNAYCPTLLFQIDATKYNALSAGGTWGVYLLDTRVKDANGNTTLATVTAGKPAVVNSAVVAASATPAGVGADGSSNVAVAGATTLGGAAAVLSVIDAPAITAVKVDGGKVTITVNGMVQAATYKVVSAANVSDIKLDQECAATQNGNDFTVDASAGSFFKVIGTRKFGEAAK